MSTALTTKVESGSPYQLSSEQTLKASKALLAHIKSIDKTSAKSTLFADEEASADDTSAPIWLTVTTKKHITTNPRLKPSTISVPHSLHASPALTICLITADPQRTFKDLVASPAFPKSLSSRITKVIGLSKLKAKWTQYEAQRKLFAEYDLFLADERIVNLLPKFLGKTFYKSTTKRPIPVVLTAPAPKPVDGKRAPRRSAGTPQNVAKEIEKVLQSAVVTLSASTNTAVKIGYAGWEAAALAKNVEVVTNGLVEKFVGKKWRGVKGVYVKGQHTAALPIWLAEELWEDEDDVLGDEEVKLRAAKEANVGKKRKALSAPVEEEPAEEVDGEEASKAKVKKAGKKQKLLKESNDNQLDKEIAARKEKLKKQKEEAINDIDNDMPVSKTSKTSKKGSKAQVDL